MKRILKILLCLGCGAIGGCEIENLHEVAESIPPTADFLPSTSDCTPPCEVVFTNQSKNATTYRWDFDDDSENVITESPTHTFNRVGDYNVQLLAYNSKGIADSITKQISVQSSVDCILVADFDIISAAPCKAPCTLNFSNNSIGATSYHWDFGDGNTSTEETPQHSYTRAGTYTITLTAIQDENCQKMSEQVQIVITNTFEAHFGSLRSEHGNCVIETKDGHFLIAGSSYSFGQYTEMYLLKIDVTGRKLWHKTYGYEGFNGASSIVETHDGNYMLLGNKQVEGRSQQAYLIKTDTAGMELWAKHYGGLADETGNALIKTNDGYAIAGNTYSHGNNSQAYLTKLDMQGDSLWSYIYGGADVDAVAALMETSMGDFVVVGNTRIGNNTSLHIQKVSASGMPLWSRPYGGENLDSGADVLENSAGDYVIVGTTNSFGNLQQVYLIQLDVDGKELLETALGETDNEAGRSIVEDAEGGYMITGSTNSFGQLKQVYLLHTDAEGTIQNQKHFGGAEEEYGQSIIRTHDGGYAIVGYTDSFGDNGQVYFLKTDAEGNVN